jgi:hypothetical protein
MGSTSLDVHSGILGFQQTASLLDAARSIKEHTINTGAYWIKLCDPGIKQGGNESGILLATLD